MRTVCIRVDSSFSIGSGHVIRCRTLARKLTQLGIQVTFLCRPQPGDLISLLKAEFCVLLLPELAHRSSDLVLNHTITGRDYYACLLGCTQERDASDTLNALSASGIQNIDWLIAD